MGRAAPLVAGAISAFGAHQGGQASPGGRRRCGRSSSQLPPLPERAKCPERWRVRLLPRSGLRARGDGVSPLASACVCAARRMHGPPGGGWRRARVHVSAPASARHRRAARGGPGLLLSTAQIVCRTSPLWTTCGRSRLGHLGALQGLMALPTQIGQALVIIRRAHFLDGASAPPGLK